MKKSTPESSQKQPVSREKLRALFESAGHEDGLRNILLDFYARMARDVMIGFFFEGKNLADIVDKQIGFLLRAAGLRESYSGKAPAAAHLELPKILPGHFDRRLRILEETLSAHGLTPDAIATWVAFESAFRDGIVRD